MGSVNITDWSKPEYYKTIQFSDIDGDGKTELVVRSIDGVLAYKFNGTDWSELSVGPKWSDDLYWNQECYYETIQCADIDGDGKAELLGRSMDCIEVWKYNGTDWVKMANGPAWSDNENWVQECYYETIQCADIDGDGKAELIARCSFCIEVWKYNESGWVQLVNGPEWSDSKGWDQNNCYKTIQCADIDGDGKAELIARSISGIEVWKYNETGWVQMVNGPAWSNEENWQQACYYETIQCADIDGDGKAELIARGSFCIEVWKYNETGWVMMANGPAWSDKENWQQACYYETIQCADIDGDGKAELLARGSFCIEVWKYNETGWVNLMNGPAWSDKENWLQACYYETIQCADIDGDGRDELIGRGAQCIEAYKLNWCNLPNGPEFSDNSTL